jgi:hypothetical protein
MSTPKDSTPPTKAETPQPPAEAAKAVTPKPDLLKEIGGPAGPEPTRYNDWERKGRVSDF